MKILMARHYGWCFGVRAAVARVITAARREPVTVLGELVHNETVNAALRARGVRFARAADEIATVTVVISAHGVAESVRQRLSARGGDMVETTCPLVHVAHRAVRELVAAGYHPVIVGQREHVEVRGLTGDLAEFDVVLSAADVARLAPRPKFGVAAQTTQPFDKVQSLVAQIRRQFPAAEVRFIDTVCAPTKQRQLAAIELAQRCDVVVVIGGRRSNNTRELAETCARFCERVWRIESESELEPAWFDADDTVGLTAGTSTPDDAVEAVERRLRFFANEHDETKQKIRRAAVGTVS